MKTLAAYAIAAVVGIGAIGYVHPYLFERTTNITETEIVIKRGIGFGTTLTYAKNRQSGDERMVYNQLVPFYASVYYTVDYSAACKCIARTYRNDDAGTYSVTLSESGVWLTSGKIVILTEKIPIARVQDKFDQAKIDLDDARNRFADIVPQ